MLDRFLSGGRVVLRVGCVTAALTLAGMAQADLLPGYAAGTPTPTSQTSFFVLDFGLIGGDSYLFEYHYEDNPTDPASGEDLLLALDTAGDLVVDHQFFDFGGPPSIFVDGFSFAGQAATPGFEGTQGESWSYWVADEPPINSSDWTSANTGPTDRLLTDGSYDGWSLNVSSFNSGGFPPINDPPTTVPEPGTAGIILLIGSAGLAYRRRRR